MRSVRRHRLSTRLWHWFNLIVVAVLFMSGLNISNAHPWLYWGDWGFEAKDAWLHVIRFPGWATIPGHYDLAAARDWHLLAAFPFAVALLFMWIAMLVNGHFWRDLRTSSREWRWDAIVSDIRAHLRLQFDHGGGRYNFLQKVSYGAVLGILLPLMIVTGMGISPGWQPALSWLIDLFGGRQSMRSIHFLTAWAIFGFFAVHVVMVLLSGPVRQLRDMVTGGRA